MNKTPPKYRSFLICLIFGLVTFAVFYQLHSFKFITFDDPDYVFENPNIKAGITVEAVKWAFTTGRSANWHPVTWLSHTLDWQLFGDSAGGHHLTSLIFHIANTLLLFLVLKKMTSAVWQSAFVAALFAIHPLHVESVAWVSERKDVLSTFFWILTMWAYAKYAQRVAVPATAKQPRHSNGGAKRDYLKQPCHSDGRAKWYLLVIVFFALGLMAKPMLVTLPFMLLLLDYWPLERFSGPRQSVGGANHVILEKIPLFVMSAASSVITFIFQKQGGAMAGKRYSFLVRLANASISYIQYIVKMVWPVRLAHYYPHCGENISILYAAAAAAILLGVTILVIYCARRHKYLFTGWFWYIGTLVPVIGIVQVGDQAMADRYTYITLTGLFIIIAWGMPELIVKWRYKKNVIASSAVLVILAMSILAWFQVGYWENSKTLYQHTLNVTRNNYTANIHMSEAVNAEGNLEDAIYYCSQAIRIKPGAVRGHLRMGYLLRQAGRLDESAQEYQKCFQARPDDPIVLNGFGATLSRQGKYDEAIKYFSQALRIRPDYAAAQDNIGHALAVQGKLDEASVYLAEALRLDPASALTHYHFGQVQLQRGEISEAISYFKEAMRLKPDWPEPMNSLAWLLAVSDKAAVRNPGKAVELAKRVCELTDYRNPELLDTLAVAYAATGDFDSAVETAEKALNLCQSPEKNTLKKEIETRLLLFKANESYIEK